MTRCPRDGTLLGSPYATCPICKKSPFPHPLLKRNPKPSQVPSGKRKVVKYCNKCDKTIVRASDFFTCPQCGGRVY